MVGFGGMCNQLGGHMIAGSDAVSNTRRPGSEAMHHGTSLLDITADFHKNIYLPMPPIRSAKHLCPICLKVYNTDYWLSRHIDLDHPRYSQQVASQKQSKASSSTKLVSPFRSRKGGNLTLKGLSATPGVLFFANHDVVNDSNAIPSSFETPARDGAQDQSESQLSSTSEAVPTSTQATTDTFPEAGTAVAYAATLEEQNAEACFQAQDPFYPFASEEEYNFAELVTLKGIPANVIDTMLKGNCGLDKDVCSSLKSNYHLRRKIDCMQDGLGHGSWKKSTLSMAWNEQHPDPIIFWHRDLIGCTKWILRQPAYKEHLVYAPVRSFNTAGQRVYDEMCSADWWWETQVNHHSNIDEPESTTDWTFRPNYLPATP